MSECGMYPFKGISCTVTIAILVCLQALLNNSHYYHMAKDDFSSRGIKGTYVNQGVDNIHRDSMTLDIMGCFTVV